MPPPAGAFISAGGAAARGVAKGDQGRCGLGAERVLHAFLHLTLSVTVICFVLHLCGLAHDIIDASVCLCRRGSSPTRKSWVADPPPFGTSVKRFTDAKVSSKPCQQHYCLGSQPASSTQPCAISCSTCVKHTYLSCQHSSSNHAAMRGSPHHPVMLAT